VGKEKVPPLLVPVRQFDPSFEDGSAGVHPLLGRRSLGDDGGQDPTAQSDAEEGGPDGHEPHPRNRGRHRPDEGPSRNGNTDDKARNAEPTGRRGGDEMIVPEADAEGESAADQGERQHVQERPGAKRGLPKNSTHLDGTNGGHGPERAAGISLKNPQHGCVAVW